MAVVPLVLRRAGAATQTVAATLEDYNAHGGDDGPLVLIYPIDENQLDEEGASNVSYDLTVGEQYADHRDRNIQSTEHGVTIGPGNAVIVQTRETLRIPRSRFAQIVPKVGILQQGLSPTTSKVDPGYNGKLLITVFNLGKRKVELQPGGRFCSLCVMDVLPGARLYNKGQKSLRGQQKASFRALKDSFEANTGVLVAVSILVSIVLIVVNLVQLLK